MNHSIDTNNNWRNAFYVLRRLKFPWLGIVGTLAFTMFYLWIMSIVPEYTGKLLSGHFEFRYIFGTVFFNLLTITMMNVSTYLKSLCCERMLFINKPILWNHFMRLPMGYLDERGPSYLVSAITNDLSQLVQVTIQVLVTEPSNLFYLVTTLMIVRNYHIKLSLTFILMIPIIMVLAIVIGRWDYKTTSKINIQVGKLTQYLSLRTRNLPLIKSMTAESFEDAAGEKVTEKLFDAKFESSAVTATKNMGSTVLSVISTLISVSVASFLLKRGEIDSAQWIAFFYYQATVTSVLSSYYVLWPTLKQGQASSRRLHDILCRPLETEQIYEDRPLDNPSIQLEGISFGYGEKKVLHHVSFEAPAYHITAIMGNSGSGKTTLLNLVERFYEPEEGSIFIGGHSLKEIPVAWLRSHVAYVTQEAGMFAGTIREALLYGINRNVSETEIIEALELVSAKDMVWGFQLGLETQVGELGEKLSGGQRQRLVLARAYLMKAQILLLDEPTSALDAETIPLILEAILRLKQTRTVLLVSHQLVTLSIADQIVYLQNGKVNAVGNHETLWESNEDYREMVLSQEVSYGE